MMPAARHELVLFGLSEGLVHAASIVDRKSVKVRALVSLGAPAEPLESLTRWREVERIMETLPEFDPQGKWDRQRLEDFQIRLENTYEQFRQDASDDGSSAGRPYWRRSLEWWRMENGVLVPYTTGALRNLHYYGRIAPLEVMQRHAIPGLFVWGDRDRKVGLDRQVRLAQKACKSGAAIRYLRYAQRHHLLAKRLDAEWLEPSLMPLLAQQVRAFLVYHAPPGKKAGVQAATQQGLVGGEIDDMTCCD